MFNFFNESANREQATLKRSFEELSKELDNHFDMQISPSRMLSDASYRGETLYELRTLEDEHINQQLDNITSLLN